MTRRVTWSGLGQSAWLFVVFGYLVAPTVFVVWMSFGKDDVMRFPPHLFSTRWYAEFAGSEDWTTAALRSVGVAAATAVLSTVLGTIAALAVVRGRLPFRRPIELLVISPMIVPPIVLAVGGYGLFVRMKLVGSLAGLALVHTVLAVPYVFLVVSAALYRLDAAFELASMSLGAGRWTTLRRITVPLILPAVLTGSLFAFLTSFDEVVLALFLVSTVGPTLPIKVFSGIVFAVTPIVAAVSTLTVAASLVGLMLLGTLRVWQRRRFGQVATGAGR